MASCFLLRRLSFLTPVRLLKTSVLSISEKLVSPIRQASFLYRLNVSKRFWVSLVSEELVTFSTPKNLVIRRRHDVCRWLLLR